MPNTKEESQEPKEEEEEEEEEEEDSSYVWDNDTKLYIHHSSGFYHDPVAGWYYSSKDGLYYKHEDGEYVPLQFDESGLNPPEETDDLLAKAENVSPSGCSNDRELELSERPSSWLEDTLIERFLADNNQQRGNEIASGVGDDDDDDEDEELEEGEWIPENDFEPQEESFDEAGPSKEEEMWQAQYGQAVESPEKTIPEISSVDLWDWKLVCESREASNEQVARLVGRLVRRSTNLHPCVASSGTLFKTAPICEARIHLVRVRTGQVYKLRNPSAKYLASLSAYDSSNPTKDWGFPDISTTWRNPDRKRKSKKAKRRKAKKAKPKTECELTVKPQIEVEKIDERSCSYRDRAAERRNLHGGYGVGPGQKGTMAEEEDANVSEEDTTAEAMELSFGIGSYARRIMGNMGWKEGDTLGKNTKGLVEPIQPVGNTGNVGLGFPQRRR